VWFSLTFKNDVRVIKKASEMHDSLVDELKRLMPTNDFTTQCLFQPIPTIFTEHSIQRGGNMLGLERVDVNALLWLITGSTKTPKQHEIMSEKLAIFSATLEGFAKHKDVNIDWQYLNYVDQTQNPLKSYGKENLDFMHQVAAKYDPFELFQKKIVSGWKISKISGS